MVLLIRIQMTEPKVLDLMVSRLPASETSFANLPDVEVCFTCRHTNAQCDS